MFYNPKVNNNKMSKHLVTGSSGYVGSFIVRKLVELGESVVCLDLLEPHQIIKGKTTHITGSVLDRVLVDSLTKECDYVHHNAALVPLTKSGKEFRSVNVDGTACLLASSIQNNVKHFCHMSSSAVFGLPKELPLLNSSSRIPCEIYGQSKKDAEDLVLACIASNPNFSCSVIRPRTILGTERMGIFELLFRWISQGKDIFVIGKADLPFQFAHIDDIVNASVFSCLKSKKGIYNVGTLEFNSLSEDLSSLIKYAKTKSRIIHLPEKLTIAGLSLLDNLKLSPFAPWHYLTYHKPFYFDSSYVYEELDYEPKGSNKNILEQAYKHYKDNNINPSIHSSSPHRSSLKSGMIDFLASMISLFP